MDRFSVSVIPYAARLYTCSPTVFQQVLLPFSCLDWGADVLALTVLEEEVTLYVYDKPGTGNQETHTVLRRFMTADPRRYEVYDLHEDVPGIDHVGIIHRISGAFLAQEIPILYLNTFGHNLVLVAEEYHEAVRAVLRLDGSGKGGQEEKEEKAV